MRKTQAIRALVAFGIGIYITFSQSHSAQVGLLSLTIFGIAFGLTYPAAAVVFEPGLPALESLPLGVAAILIGIFAALSPLQPIPAEPASVFIWLVMAWGLISAAFELYQARRRGFRTDQGRDHLISATFSFLLGVLFLAVPLDIVSAVGFFGAYLALSGVHLGISAATPTRNNRG